MKHIKTFFWLCLLLGVFAGLLLHISSTPGFAQQNTLKIAVVTHGASDDPFWRPVQRGVEDAAELYDDLVATYTGTTVYNIDEFMENLEAAIASKPDALVCTLTAPERMDPLLRNIIQAGLPVVAINAPDLRMPESERIPVLTYVGEDSYLVGKTAAQETLERFTPKRAVFCNHQPGAVNIEARGQGWVETMQAAGVEAEAIDVTSNPEQAADLVAAYIKANPDTDALFITNIGVTPVVIHRLEAAGVAVGNNLKIAQMDISTEVLEAIQDGKIMFTLDQQPYMQGYMGVVFAYLSAKFGFTPPPAPVSTGPAVVTAAEINPTRNY